MPRTAKMIVPENERHVAELGLVGRANKRTGKTEWVVEQQSIGEISGKIYDQIVLMNDVADPKTGEVKNVPVSGAKPYCQGFIDGYTYRMSEEAGE